MNPPFEKAAQQYDINAGQQHMIQSSNHETTSSPAPVYHQTSPSPPANVFYGAPIQQQQQWPQPQLITQDPGQQQWHQPRPVVQEKGFSSPQQVPVQASPYRQAVAIPSLGRSSAPVDCPSCGQRHMTAVTYHPGNTTHVWAGVLCCLGTLLCWVPYLINSLKDVEHKCANCGRLLATWHKSGSVETHAYV